MADSFDFETFFDTQITVPLVENITNPITPPSLFVNSKKEIKEREGTLLHNYLKYTRFTQQHIDVYNQFIKRIANIITAKIIELKDGRTIQFGNLKFNKPTYKMENKERILYPQYARRNYLTYDAELTADMFIREHNKVIYTNKPDRRITIMRMPVMLQSMLCHLENKTSKELKKLGEDPIEQGGYFIIEGVEKIILLEEKLAANRMFIMHSSPKIKTYRTSERLTTNTSKGTSVDELIYNLQNIMKYSLTPLNKKQDPQKKLQQKQTKKINVILLFQLFSILYLDKQYCYTYTDIQNLIRPFLIDQRALRHLLPSFAAIQAINKNKTKPVTAVEVILKKANQTALSDKDKVKYIKNDILKSVFQHLQDIDPYENETQAALQTRVVKNKVTMLVIMVAKYLNYLGGYAPLDDRDDWSNKRVEGPGRKMEQLTRSAWNKVTQKLVNTKLKDYVKNEEIEKAFHSSEVNDAINKIFRDSFINSKWGTKGGNQKNNVTQTLVHDNMLATLSHINTVNVNIQRTDKKVEIRVEQSSQYRYICYVKYSEGSNSGLLKNIAMTTRLSLDRGIEGDRVIEKYIQVTEEKTITNQHILMLNGRYIGWCQGPELRKKLIQLRREGALYFDTSFYIDHLFLYIDASPSRMLTPLLIVDEETQELVIDLKNIKDLRPENLIQEGAMEYVSPWEENNLKIAEDVEHLWKRKQQIQTLRDNLKEAQLKLKTLLESGDDDPTLRNDITDFEQRLSIYSDRFTTVKDGKFVNRPYTHCEISGRAALGPAADMIPFLTHNTAARNIFQSGMGTQAVGNYHLNHKCRFDGTVKVLESPIPPIVKTALYDTLGLAERGMGQNVIVAFMAMPGSEEDAFIFNQGSIDRGLFRMVKYFTYDCKLKISDPNIKAYFGKPPLGKNESEEKYQHINASGMPIIGSFIRAGECIVGVVKEKDGVKYNHSCFMNNGDEGIVEDVIFRETMKFEIVTVKFRITRLPDYGDKFAARMAQKGTIGRILKYEDMPFSQETGIVPDIIVNPTVIPSRMTISYLMEMLAGKAAAYFGETVDASAFQEVRMDIIQQKLRDVGFNPQGYERLRSGETGQLLECEIYMGVVYFQALKHQPADKMSVRSRGVKTSATRQPVKGRQRGGGIRFGSMEVDALLSHGTSGAIQERMCYVSDKYQLPICKPCGSISVYNEIEKKFYCPICSLSDAAIVTIPYALKFHNNLSQSQGFKPKIILNKTQTQTQQESENIEEVENTEESGEESAESEDEVEYVKGSEESSSEEEEEFEAVSGEEEEDFGEDDYGGDDDDY